MVRFINRILTRIIISVFGVSRTLSYKWKKNPLNQDNNLLDSRPEDCLFKATHNSYLSGPQLFGASSLDSIVFQLNDGVRCLEIDIFKHIDTDDLVITHGDVLKHIQGTSYVYLVHVLDLIAKYAWKDTQLPLILFIEIQIFEPHLYSKINTLFRRYFKKRIYTSDQPRDTIRDLMGKVLICCTNSFASMDPLKDYVNCIPYRNIPSSYEFHSDDDYIEWNSHNFTRVYPKNFIRSTNYDPDDFLLQHCQILTINYQYCDKYFDMYQQIFPTGYGIIRRNVYDLVRDIHSDEQV